MRNYFNDRDDERINSSLNRDIYEDDTYRGTLLDSRTLYSREYREKTYYDDWYRLSE